MSTLPRGICPVCGEERQLTKAGVMRYHKTPRLDRWYAGFDCDGIGQPPKSVVADPVAAAEERGYARAITDLRTRADEERVENPDNPTMWAVFLAAADYLEFIAPGETKP